MTNFFFILKSVLIENILSRLEKRKIWHTFSTNENKFIYQGQNLLLNTLSQPYLQVSRKLNNTLSFIAKLKSCRVPGSVVVAYSSLTSSPVRMVSLVLASMTKYLLAVSSLQQPSEKAWLVASTTSHFYTITRGDQFATEIPKGILYRECVLN